MDAGRSPVRRDRARHVLTADGNGRSAIGLMSYAALAFTFKFAWAPLIDEYDPPLVGGWLGRRRGWMLLAQPGVAAGLMGLAFGAPAESLGWNVAFAFLTAFAAASQERRAHLRLISGKGMRLAA